MHPPAAALFVQPPCMPAIRADAHAIPPPPCFLQLLPSPSPDVGGAGSKSHARRAEKRCDELRRMFALPATEASTL